MIPHPPRNPRNASRALLVLIGLWVLSGAAFKLFLGSPADLPPVLRELPLGIHTTFQLAIGIELVVVAFAILRPRPGWLLAAAQLVAFDVVLLFQIAAGDASCGCFGGKITIPPAAMLAIDSALLLGLLASRPWTRLPERGLPLAALGLLSAALLALPWVYDRRVEAPPALRPGGPGEGGLAAGDPEARGPGSEAPAPRDAAPVSGGYAVLEPSEWVGRDVWDTELARWVDVYALPMDAEWILYRWTCDHCAKHLETLAADGPTQATLVLVRIVEAHDNDENRSVKTLPQGPNVVHAELPATVEYVVSTPVALVLQGGKVVSALEGQAVLDADSVDH